MVRGDALHILYTKGVYGHLLGSILHYMCWKDGPGVHQTVAPCKRLAVIFTRIQENTESLVLQPASPTSNFPCSQRKSHLIHPMLF
jgi:hypothetical protein